MSQIVVVEDCRAELLASGEMTTLRGLPLRGINTEQLDLSQLWVYVLQLQEEKWYVGQTKDPVRRFAQHIEGSGAVWTQIYRPTGKALLMKVDEPAAAHGFADPVTESSITLQMMGLFGIENVRGAGWSKIALLRSDQNSAQSAIDALRSTWLGF
jgi:hypothetical protein